MQPEGGAHRLRQLGHRVLDLAKGFPRRDRRLGRPDPGIGGVGGGVEVREQAPLQTLPPDPVEGEVAHHPPDIGGLDARFGPGRVGDEPEHHVLHDVLGLGRTIEDAARRGEISGAMALERRQDALRGTGGSLGAGDPHGPLAGPVGRTRCGRQSDGRRVAIPG
ncbi:hypothetical protein SAMN05216360_110156 [Methylobacterium phyllostachyos]|uniref:Uncharacterized protein n=1 Tax=Methylobacterium phyllostachyos TaxID=582672 RepID=A0A1H0DGQ2_9HYPH|nr:hypothetical protein SAMN05216360_110156 [Methylobacterium phyllostachyos]